MKRRPKGEMIPESKLTLRQREAMVEEVLRLVDLGLSDQEIADGYFIFYKDDAGKLKARNTAVEN